MATQNNNPPSTPSTPTFHLPPSATSGSHSQSNLSPAFLHKLAQLRLPLAPLVQLTTGRVHPYFPSTLLNFWLLTDAELESLAAFYHQRTPSEWTRRYPCPVRWAEGLSIEAKRRKMGRFIGLRGCESPVSERGDGRGVLGLGRTEEEIEEETRRRRDAEGKGGWS